MMINMPQCSIHNVEMATSSWGGWYCKGQKMPDGTWCKEKSQADTPDKKFDEEIDRAGEHVDQSKKQALITRTAIVKSLIERGEKYDLEAIQEAERWLEWVEGKTTPVV